MVTGSVLAEAVSSAGAGAGASSPGSSAAGVDEHAANTSSPATMPAPAMTDLRMGFILRFLGFPRASFESRACYALNNLLLGDDVNEQHGEDGDDGARHHHVPLGGELALKLGECHRKCLEFIGAQD